MSSVKIHIAIPNLSDMLCDPKVNLGSLKVGYIEGHYSLTIDSHEVGQSKYSTTKERALREKYVKFGQKKPPLPYNETVPLEEIYEHEGTFIITKLIVEFPYPEKIVYNGVPKEITRIAIHEFSKLSFQPSLMKAIFDRMPSYPLYEMLKREKKKWLKRSEDYEAYKRMRATWLINKPKEALPIKVYELWYGRGAMLIPESEGDFKGREFGTEYEGEF